MFPQPNRLRPPPLWWARPYVFVAPLAAAVCAIGLSKILPPTYTATARLLPPQANSSAAPVLATRSGGHAALALSAMGAKVPSDLYAQIFFSHSVQDPVIESLQLRQHYGASTLDDARSALAARTETRIIKGGIIEVAVKDGEATRSAAVVNALVDSMYAVGHRITQDAARRQQEFYDELIKGFAPGCARPMTGCWAWRSPAV